MNWFKNWKIRTKILSIVILMVLFTGSVGFMGYYFNAKANAQITDMYSNNLLTIKYLDDTRVQTRAGQAALYNFLLTTDKDTQLALQNEMKNLSENIDKDYNAYLKIPVSDPYEIEKGAEIKTELTTYRAERQKAMDLANQGDLKGSYDYFFIAPLNSLNTTLTELADFNAKEADNSNSQNGIDYAFSKKLLITMPIISSLLCLMLGFAVAGLISNSIKKVLTSVEQVAAGDLSIEDVQIKRKDEVGQLAASFNTMKNNLHRLVRQVSESSEQVAASSEELTAIAEQNTQASVQIAASIELVAQGTEQQSGAVNEASSTVQEISASTEEVAASSSEIARSMVDTMTTTNSGQIALDRVVEQMTNIGSGSQRVHTAIIELSLNSEKIGEIIGVITSIAAQTNLLALNAAIEAARAGETRAWVCRCCR